MNFSDFSISESWTEKLPSIMQRSAPSACQIFAAYNECDACSIFPIHDLSFASMRQDQDESQAATCTASSQRQDCHEDMPVATQSIMEKPNCETQT
jgi:hypothetical protein